MDFYDGCNPLVKIKLRWGNGSLRYRWNLWLCIWYFLGLSLFFCGSFGSLLLFAFRSLFTLRLRFRRWFIWFLIFLLFHFTVLTLLAFLILAFIFFHLIQTKLYIIMMFKIQKKAKNMKQIHVPQLLHFDYDQAA